MQSGEITITVSFPDIYFSSGDTVTNYAVIWDTYSNDINELNNEVTTSPVTLFAAPPTATDLVVNKFNTVTTGMIGEPIGYIIEYMNSGAVTLTGTNIGDSLPAGFVFMSASPAPTVAT